MVLRHSQRQGPQKASCVGWQTMGEDPTGWKEGGSDTWNRKKNPTGWKWLSQMRPREARPVMAKSSIHIPTHIP